MSDESNEPTPKPIVTRENPAVEAVLTAANCVCDASECLLNLVRQFKSDTGRSICTPAEIFYVGGTMRMIESFVRDIQLRLDAINR